MGDTTLSAEAARLVLKATVGGKAVDVVTPSGSTPPGLPPNAFRYSVSSRDSTRRYFLYVNDCVASSGSSSSPGGCFRLPPRITA